MRTLYNITIAVLLTSLTLSEAIAQDAHLSQYNATPIMLNPAMTGIYDDGDMRISTNYRTQWGALSSNFTTTALAFDMHHGSRWGMGGYVLNNDLAGLLNVFNFVLSGSYEITDPLQDKYQITTGLQAGIIYKRANRNDLIFDSQYNDGNFDADLESGETLERYNMVLPEVNFGLAYQHKDKTWDVKPYAGFSLFHLTLAKESFTGVSNNRLPMRWVGNIGAKYKVNEGLILDPSVLYMRQREAQEINFGMIANYRINETAYYLLGGLHYRMRDALIIHAGMRHKRNVYRVSYDINTSSLNDFSNKRGGIELSIIYTPKNYLSKPKI